MCGLVGVAGNLFADDIKVFNQMLYCDFLRGPHATGVAAVRNGVNVSLLKKAWEPRDLMGLKAYDNIVTMQAEVLIGHNRHGTRGNNGSHANAHPFNFDRIVGAHNGTLDYSCIKNLQNNALFDTDSEALFCEINENGPDEAFTKISGAWALTYYDRKEKTLNMVRNNQRTLYFAYKKGRSVIYWASELQMLYWILGRNNIQLEEDTCYELPTDTLYTWTVGNKLEAPRTHPLASSYTPPAYTTQGTGYWLNGKFHKAEDNKDKPPFPVVVSTPSSTKPTSTGSVTDNKKSAKKSTIERFLPYKDRDKNNIHKLHFQEIMNACVCCYCGSDKSEWGDNVLFLRKTSRDEYPDFLCEECHSDPDIVSLCV